MGSSSRLIQANRARIDAIDPRDFAALGVVSSAGTEWSILDLVPWESTFPNGEESVQPDLAERGWLAELTHYE